MKKTIAAVVAGALLITAQAAVAQSGAAPRVGDRLGAASGEASEFTGGTIIAVVAGIAIAAAVISIASDDDSDSD